MSNAAVAPARPQAAIGAANGTTQLVVFGIASREYALPVENVSEIFRMVAISPVPEAPPWLPGVINLRGRVVPVFDLRTRLSLPREDYTLQTPILVAETEGRMLGLIADAVVELLTLPVDSIAPPDDALTGSTSSVAAVARSGDRLIMIFDLARLCADSSRLALPGKDAVT